LIDSGAFEKVFNTYSGIHEGERTSLTVADIDGDGKLEMVVGNYRGGLAYFKQIDSIALGIDQLPTLSAGFSVYPDPANEILNVKSNVVLSAGSTISIVDMLGRKMSTQQTGPFQMNQVVSINVEDLAQGLYICIIQTGQGTKALQFMKE